MYETRLMSYNVPVSAIVPEPGNSSSPDFDMHSPQVVQLIGEDWEPMSHTLLPLGETILVSILLRRRVQAPDVEAFTGV
jgi:hypothetical protein